MVAQVVSSRPHGVSKIKALGLSPCSECPFPVLCAAPEMDLLGSSPGWNMGGVGSGASGVETASEWLLSPIPAWYLVLVIQGSAPYLRAQLPISGTSWPPSGPSHLLPLLTPGFCTLLLALWGGDTVWLQEGSEKEYALSLSLTGLRTSLRPSGLCPSVPGIDV